MCWIVGCVLVLFLLVSKWACVPPYFYPVLIAGAIVSITPVVLWYRHEINLKFHPIYVLLVALLICVWIRCLIDHGGMDILNGLFITSVGISLLIIGQRYGLKVLWPIVIVAAIQSISVIVISIFFSDWAKGMDIRNGGFIDRHNYALGYAVIALGLLAGLYLIKAPVLKAIYVSICTLGILFTGSPSGLVLLAIIGVCAIIHRNWSKLVIYGLAVVSIVFGVWVAFGPGWTEYDRTREVTNVVTSGDITDGEYWDNNTTEDKYSWGRARLPLYKQAIENISLTGHGYMIYNAQKFYQKVHNVPLVIVDQVGIIAAITWLVVTLYCLIKGKFKYLWLGLIAMGLFDHITWTVFAPFWWLLIGITLSFEGYRYVFKTSTQTALCR